MQAGVTGISTLNGGEWYASRSSRFTYEERARLVLLVGAECIPKHTVFSVVLQHLQLKSCFKQTHGQIQQDTAHHNRALFQRVTAISAPSILGINPFQSNFSANCILPSSYLLWAGKRLVDYLLAKVCTT